MTITERVAATYRRVQESELSPVWISLVSSDQVQARARQVENGDNLPLAGMTFAVKDNIDVAGMATTAACPAYAYTAAISAPVVRNLEDAGAVLIGKTNMDQFATGLVGTRSPYGACASVFDKRYISGGSSSGSAVAVAKELVTFALGTDTAGSGRVPAAFNGLIGLKPTRGLLSTAGVVPACRSLDCVSIFARSCFEAYAVWQAAKGFDPGDPFSRTPGPGDDAAPWLDAGFRFGVPAPDQLEFFGDQDARSLYEAATKKLQAMGGEKIEIDYSIFFGAGNLLYEGPWVAERLTVIQEFMRDHSQQMNSVVREIIAGGNRHTAVDAFNATYKLRSLCQAAAKEWAKMDVMVLPTTGIHYTHDQVASSPIKSNTSLGYYTNFVNMMDLAAVAVPAGFRANGLPFGISLVGRTFSDAALLELASRYLAEKYPLPSRAPGCIQLAVVGAHLKGQPLHWQLAQRNARLAKVCRTAAGYRLFALPGTDPPKPGLVRDETFDGPGIEVEVWTLPENHAGSLLASVPPPLAIGTITLDDGQSVKGFISEACAISDAVEITSYGGWRSYLESFKR